MTKPHWIDPNRRPKSFMYVCSECGKTVYDTPQGSRKNWVVKPPCKLQHCPHCGVKMEIEVKS